MKLNRNLFCWCLFTVLFGTQIASSHAADTVDCPDLTQKVFKSTSLKTKILDAKGKPLEKYKGMKGYAKFAKEHGGAGRESYMGSVFQNVSAILDKETFEQLEWKYFNKTVEEFFAYPSKILDANGNPLEKYKGMEGYARFARNHGGSVMMSTFKNASAVLDEETFKSLNWKIFQGTVDDYFSFPDKILDADGRPFEKYFGMEGYARFSEEHGKPKKYTKPSLKHNRSNTMLPIFMNASAVLDKKTFESLNWKMFDGTVKEFFTYRDKILDAEGRPLEKYLGMKGYA